MSRVKGIDPGRLNHRVTIKRYAEKEDDLGNTVNELVPVKTVWAEILPIKGQEGLEYYKNNQCIEDKDHSVPEGTEGDGEDHGGD